MISSGGIGPTHDDLTMEGVASAFKRGGDESGARRVICKHYRERWLDAGLRMAEVPEGAVLNDAGDIRCPTVQVENVYVLPGIPELFESKLRALSTRFAPIHISCVRFTWSKRRGDGGTSQAIASAGYPTLMHRSCPRIGHPGVSREVDARVEGCGISGAAPFVICSAASGRGNRGNRMNIMLKMVVEEDMRTRNFEIRSNSGRARAK